MKATFKPSGHFVTVRFECSRKEREKIEALSRALKPFGIHVQSHLDGQKLELVALEFMERASQ